MPSTLLKRIRAIKPWQRTLTIIFVAQLFSAVGMSTVFPFLPLYVDELGTNTSLDIAFLAGAVYSAQAATMMVAAPMWGGLADRFGRKVMVQRAMFGGAIIILLMGYARTAEELVLLRAIQGLITGVVSAANALVASAAPRERTGYAMGMIQVALRGGIAIGPFLGGAIADAFGYRPTFTVTALLLLSGGVLVHFGVEETVQPTVQAQRRTGSMISRWRHVLGTSGVKPTYSVRFLAGLASLLIVPIVPLFVESLLPDSTRVNTTTGLTIGVASAATTATAVYFGRLGDRIGHRRILQICGLMAGLFFLPQGFVTEAWHLLSLQALTGAAVGGIVPTVSALLAAYTEPGEEGSVYGLDSSIFAASRAIAPLAGSALAVWFGFPSVFLVTGLLYFSLALLAIWRLPDERPRMRLEVGD
jgi:DHA1 family multidrug resistance protein-like MFS transporter